MALAFRDYNGRNQETRTEAIALVEGHELPGTKMLSK